MADAHAIVMDALEACSMVGMLYAFASGLYQRAQRARASARRGPVFSGPPTPRMKLNKRQRQRLARRLEREATIAAGVAMFLDGRPVEEAAEEVRGPRARRQYPRRPYNESSWWRYVDDDARATYGDPNSRDGLSVCHYVLNIL